MRIMLLLAANVLLCYNAANSNGQDWTALEKFDRALLEGKWVVVAVEVDGDFSKAQIGQRPNDVITLSSDLNVGLPRIG